MKQTQKHIVNISITKSSDFSFKPKTKSIQKYISFLLSLLCDFPTEVSIRFCGEEEMLQTNSQFRYKAKATDVLSFIPDFSIEHNPNYLGDILICIPVCAQQAKRAKHSLSQELIKMMTHALVHLKGFDHDRSDASARVMKKLEKALIQELKTEFGDCNLVRD